MDESQGTVNTNGDCMRKQDGRSHSLPCIINKSGDGCIVLVWGFVQNKMHLIHLFVPSLVPGVVRVAHQQALSHSPVHLTLPYPVLYPQQTNLYPTLVPWTCSTVSLTVLSSFMAIVSLWRTLSLR